MKKEIVAFFFLITISFLGITTCFFSMLPILTKVKNQYERNTAEGATLIQHTKVFLTAFENSFSETVFLSSFFAGIDANVSYFLTGNVVSRQVLKGKDDWLFYKTQTDGSPIADYQGTGHFSNKKMSKMLQCLSKIKNDLNSKGIQLIVMLIPNKERIYGNKMPHSIQIIDTLSRTDVLVKYLQRKGFNDILYPKHEMLKNRDNFYLYYKYDSHWNYLGAFIAEQQLLDKLYGTRTYLAQQTIVAKKKSGAGDLANMVHLSWHFKDDREYYIEKVPNYVKTSSSRIYENRRSQFSDSVLFIGDSYRKRIKPFLYHDFRKVLVIHRDEYTGQVLQNFKPNVVVLEWAERYSSEILQFKLY